MIADEWECATCTYHNPNSSNICEMFSKTKDKSYKTTLLDGIEQRAIEVSFVKLFLILSSNGQISKLDDIF